MKVEMIGGDNCRFCTMAKTLLESKNLSYKYSNVKEDASALQKLKDKGLRTIPQIWIDDEHIGDYTELHTFLRNR